MTLDKALRLSASEDEYIRDVYEIVSKGARMQTIAGDSMPLVQFTASQVEEISNLGYQKVQSNYISAGMQFETLQEAHDKVVLKIAGDALINRATGIGTMNDPSVYTHSQLPIMMGPYEGTSIYSPGGLPAQIVDKKSRAMVQKGATFKTLDEDFWDNDKLKKLEDAAVSTGFNDKINDATADAHIYGGSIIYPVFKGDTASRYLRPMDDLGLDKDCIDRWVETDRWNTVIVPSYIVTADDYLNAKSLLIPQSALDVSTTRMALCKPKPMPYWAALYNIGWSPSDIAGWIRPYYGYEITMQSIPVMAQQMSLLLYRMPLDALNATIGPDKVTQLMEINETKMKEWSALSPKAVNMIGEVEVVNRTYSGFEQFIGAMKSDLAAQCGIPEPSLWHTPNKGFSDNTTESLLKQSEALQMSQAFLERSMGNCTKALIAHVFGQNSDEYRRANEVRMSFDKPIISTEKDSAEIGARFSASVASFAVAGVSPDIAIRLASQFFPTVKLTEELLTEAKKSYDEQMDRQEKMAQQKMQMGSTGGNSMEKSSGKATGTGTKVQPR